MFQAPSSYPPSAAEQGIPWRDTVESPVSLDSDLDPDLDPRRDPQLSKRYTEFEYSPVHLYPRFGRLLLNTALSVLLYININGNMKYWWLVDNTILYYVNTMEYLEWW